MAEVVHRCPETNGITPCCGKTPFELPRTDRIATDPDLVTCWTGGDPRLRPVPCHACRVEACEVEGNTAEPHTCGIRPDAKSYGTADPMLSVGGDRAEVPIVKSPAREGDRDE